MLLLLAFAACTDRVEDPPVRHRVTGGDDPATKPDPPDRPTDPGTTTDPTAGGERRYDCSGMDPADPAPLGGKVALTFDDGPDPVDTARAVDLLRAHGVPATFLMLGQMASEPDAWTLVEDIAADPLFRVGNHSWTHSDLADLGLGDVEAEVDDTTAVLEDLGATVDFFRFPYGDSTCATHDLVTARGLRVTGWHIDTADWCYAANGGSCSPWDYWRVPAEFEHDFLGLVMDQVHRFDGGILLLHDIHGWTIDQLEELIVTLRDEGYTFVSLDDPGAFPNLVAGTPADLPYLGERCDTSDDRCWMVEHMAWCEPTGSGTDGICVLPCEGYCLDRDGAATTFCAEVAPGEGRCVGRAESRNDWCEALPGTEPTWMPRHGEPAGEAEVCVPPGW